MVTSTIMTTSSPWLPDLFSWTTIGYILIVAGLITTAFSKHRYLLGYLFGGMGYWLVVEGIQSVVVNASSLNDWNSYVLSLAISWLVPAVFFLYRRRVAQTSTNLASQGLRTSTQSRFRLKGRKAQTSQEKYIEHTPIYNDYKPRFHN